MIMYPNIAGIVSPTEYKTYMIYDNVSQHRWYSLPTEYKAIHIYDNISQHRWHSFTHRAQSSV